MNRRAIFFDVENTSRAVHIDRMLRHLRIGNGAPPAEFVAVGNWRVISDETAQLLARHGARLLHSAPAVGVKDWSDLRIAVGAGIWLGGARPGDSIDIVSDDRAFDAVGDVAATLGVIFRRLSYRHMVEDTNEDAILAAPAARRRQRRRDPPRSQRGDR